MGEKHILVVEYEEVIAEVISDLLKRFGARAAVALGEASAYRQLEEACFDAVIVEYTMPLKNGLQIIEEIRSKHGNNFMIILMSGLVNEEIENKAFNAGVNMVLQKPFGTEELKNVFSVIQRNKANRLSKLNKFCYAG